MCPSILPGVAFVDVDDLGQAVLFHPEEAIYVAGSVASRRRDFALGRSCARSALAALGLEGAAISRDIKGRPVWPTGFVGSITHTKGYAAALAARREDCLCLGIDAERVGGVTDNLMPSLFDPSERAWLETFDSVKRGVLATVLFSAKEAYFKAWSAATGMRLSFPDLHIELEANGFVASQPGAPLPDWRAPVEGGFTTRDDLVVTSLCIPNREASQPS